MGILSWLRTVTEGDNTADAILTQAPMQFDKGEEQFHGLDMRAALDAHMRWTSHLEAQINGEECKDLQIVAVACDDQCTLGKWIHGAARNRFGNLPELNELQKVHANFHFAVGEVLVDLQAGQVEDARGRMREIRRQSGNVQLSLVRLYAKAHS